MKIKSLTLILAAGCFAATSLFGGAHLAHEKGWKSLFDGKTLKGWGVIQGYANYYVEDGAILGRTAEGSPNTFLHTFDHFSDFELKFEVKVDEGLN